MSTFGPHLVFDGYGCSADRLTDPSVLRRLLDELPARIHLAPLASPAIVPHSAACVPGLSAVLLLAGSHVAIHTFPERRFVSADVFSGGSFDVEDTLACLRDAFGPRRIEWKLLDRGLEYPRTVSPIRHVVERRPPAGLPGPGLGVSR